MYRLLFSLLLCAAAASGAPQDPSDASVDGPQLRADDAAPASGESVRRARQDDFYTDDEEEADTTGTAPLDTAPRVGSTPARTFGRPRPTKPSARFISFDKSGAGAASGAATNFVQILGKEGRRMFVSHCRCEKIWNCPKLQITTPRCPDEYFLCCFT